MLRQTREKDLALFVELAREGEAYSPEDLPLVQVVPAFAMSELKTAFEMGFILYLPFLVIDMVVASTLMSMGMLMLPPVLISLPFKLLLFVLVDGWGLVTRSLIGSFR
jgi:flagellar biosynthetic protein FliP